MAISAAHDRASVDGTAGPGAASPGSAPIVRIEPSAGDPEQSRRIRRVDIASAAHHADHDIPRRQVRLLTERFADDPLRTIAHGRASQDALRDREPQSRGRSRPGPGGQPEGAHGDADGRTTEHGIECSLVRQPSVALERGATLDDARALLAQSSDGQALAAFGAARVQYLAAVSRGHAGPEAVLALALDDARLVSPFHSDAGCGQRATLPGVCSGNARDCRSADLPLSMCACCPESHECPAKPLRPKCARRIQRRSGRRQVRGLGIGTNSNGSFRTVIVSRSRGAILLWSRAITYGRHGRFPTETVVSIRWTNRCSAWTPWRHWGCSQRVRDFPLIIHSLLTFDLDGRGFRRVSFGLSF